MDFRGYRRSDRRVGTRNYVGVLSTVVCANEVTDRIAHSVRGATAFMHHQGCCQTPLDVNRVSEVLVGLGKNPNLAAVLLISLGCESVVVEDVAAAIRSSGKRVESVTIQETESLPVAGTRLCGDLVAFASGKLTKAEISGYTNSMEIYVTGPVI